MSGALLDTSVLIASDEGGIELPPSAAISVVTLGELRAGVLRARDETTAAWRRRRLSAVRAAFLPLPVDEQVAERYGEALTRARDEGRVTKATDLLIVATAIATERALHTRDERQAALARSLGVVAVS